MCSSPGPWNPSPIQPACAFRTSSESTLCRHMYTSEYTHSPTIHYVQVTSSRLEHFSTRTALILSGILSRQWEHSSETVLREDSVTSQTWSWNHNCNAFCVSNVWCDSIIYLYFYKYISLPTELLQDDPSLRILTMVVTEKCCCLDLTYTVITLLKTR